VTVAAVLAAAGLLRADGAWTSADPAYRLELPRDHGSHPDHRIEWWYYTGNVATREGRRFGYQLTFFRVGVDPRPRNPSRWAVRDLHMAHLAVADIDGNRFRYADRLNRAGVGWAGAAAGRLEVWNEGWRATMDDRGRHVLEADHEGLGVRLVLDPGKPWVAQGENGYSRKGSQPGNASHYYSLTRMPSRGRVTIEGETFEVDGLSWMDHEFGSSFLERDQVGWDWFSLQFEDGTDVMVFQLRRRDGRADQHSSGTLVRPDGRTRTLRGEEIRLTPGRRWRSPASGAEYPIEWRVEVPAAGLDVRVTAALAQQELRTERSTGVTYWEGSVVAEGTLEGRAVRGRGYLEMTGYTGAPMSEVLR
jgi:predicted secreted hydrolase